MLSLDEKLDKLPKDTPSPDEHKFLTANRDITTRNICKTLSDCNFIETLEKVGKVDKDLLTDFHVPEANFVLINNIKYEDGSGKLNRDDFKDAQKWINDFLLSYASLYIPLKKSSKYTDDCIYQEASLFQQSELSNETFTVDVYSEVLYSKELGVTTVSPADALMIDADILSPESLASSLIQSFTSSLKDNLSHAQLSNAFKSYETDVTEAIQNYLKELDSYVDNLLAKI